MGREKIYYVYIMSSQLRVLYIGITSNIVHRVFQHKTQALEGFTSRYNVTSLVRYERFYSVSNAIAREKELKAWRREKKIALIKSNNPKLKDLSYEWFRRHRWQPERKQS